MSPLRPGRARTSSRGFGRFPGLKVVAEAPAGQAGYRAFKLTFRQPIDHRHPAKGSFEQRVTLMDTGVDRPTVLYTTGFMLLSRPCSPSRRS